MRSAGFGYSVVVASNEGELAQHLAAWDDLARNAVEPNAFYESWAAMPAYRTFAVGLDIRFAFVYAFDVRGAPFLCALFPLQRHRRQRFPGIKEFQLWQYPYCFVCTALVREGHSVSAVEALFDRWHDNLPGASILHLDRVYADGPFAEGLVTACRQGRRPTFIASHFLRGVINPRESPVEYLREAASGLHRKHFRRQERLLRRHGDLELRTLTPDGDPDDWADMFLSLENRGWKGRNHSAIACEESDEGFFRQLISGAFTADKLEMIGLFLDGNPVAINCNLLSGESSFAFKTTYDETYSKCSPGMVLMLRNIELLHFAHRVKRMDACTWPEHWWLNRLCLERRTMVNQYVAATRFEGSLLIWMRRIIRRMAREFRTVNKRAPCEINRNSVSTT